MINEQELNKKLAEWVGLAGIYTSVSGNVYFFADNKVEDANFTQSLDACFKWLVPNDAYITFYPMNDGRLGCLIHRISQKFEYAQEGIAEKGQYALALCRAIEKLIDGEELNAR